MKMIDKSVFDRLAQRLRFCRCSDKGEWIDRYSDIASFRHDHIDNKIFHCNIQYFFDVWFQSMDFVDKENISGFKCIQNANNF